MRTLFALIFATLVLIITSCSTDKYPEKFSYLPDNAKPGEEIEIRYKSDDPEINNSDELLAVIYSFSKELDNTENIKMTKDGEGWVANYKTTDSTKGLILKFSIIKKIDDNDKKGYIIKLKDDDGNDIKGANAALGGVLVRYSGAIDLLSARDSATAYFEKDFSNYPELKRYYLNYYISSFPRTKRTRVANEELAKLEKETDLNQHDLETLVNGFRTNGQHRKSLKYYEILLDKYPKSRLVTAKYYTRFRNMVRIDRMLEVFNEFVKINPESDLNNFMVSSILNEYARLKQYDNVKKTIEQYPQYISSTALNTLAWNLYERDIDLDKAVEYCKIGIEKAREDLKNPQGTKPVYMAYDDWKNSKSYSLAMILDTFGSIKNKLGDKDEAIKLFEEAFNLTKRQNIDINENYIALLHEMNRDSEAKPLIEQLISEGKANDNLRNILKDIFTKESKNEEEFEKYVSKFDQEAKADIVAKLKKEMIKTPAPDFELMDLKGNKVKLADFKGKTVIIDFWATWCGPCLKSFPVMKKVVEKYSDDPSVKFLFVNTWEKVDDKKENAQDFIKRSKYPFHVLVDDQNKVVEKYKVQGIPTKFILDPELNIRFKSVGFSGVEKEVIDELDEMIKLTK